MRLNSLIFRMWGFGLWAALMLVLAYPHDWVTLANAPVVLVLVSSIYSLLLPLALSLALSALAVLMFNYQMVPPVHTFHVDLHEHGILLITMMGVSWLITYLLRRQKQIAALERQQAQRTLQLMQWSETLREVDKPEQLLSDLQQLLFGMAEGCAQVVVGFAATEVDSLNAAQIKAFNACLKENKALGKSTGRYDNLEDLYLPMRGKSKAYGVCVCVGGDVDFNQTLWVRDAQALLDQMGLACERRDNVLRAQSARESAQTQKTRSLFLTSIAHDQRTPLASIMTSASAILEQTDRLSKDEIRHYAELIQEESQQVARLTDNTLTLARLSGEQVQVPMQLESVEDMVAAVLQRLRKRKTLYLPTVKVDAGLPLVNCNMVLVEQVLDNLIDNAMKHSGAPGSVELLVLQQQNEVVFQVADRGQGMQGQHKLQGDESRGLGIGLQLCHAVAQVHSGRLNFSSPANSGQGVLATFALPLAAVQEQHA
ncbi:ATP-binding protein [Limnobacter alexandrii]|uniref:ATP-binding protein n=1 Tax=Limnobacter alexandrii TaxID=2570352 RepID=UPI0011081697|nr:ATP-binding protein [Limnobacter alexandrii]